MREKNAPKKLLQNKCTNKTQFPSGSLDRYYSKTLTLTAYFQLFKEELFKGPAGFSKMF